MRHGIPRVDHQIQHDLLGLAGVGHHHQRFGRRDDLELDFRTDQPPQHRVHAPDDVAERKSARPDRLTSAEGEQLPRETGAAIDRLFDFSRLGARRVVAAPACISSRSAAPMMLIRMLLKSCATPPASRPIASSFCDWRSCSSSARRSVMSRTKPVSTVRVSVPSRATVNSRGKSVPSARRPRQFKLPAGERSAAGRHVLVERMDVRARGRPAAAAVRRCGREYRSRAIAEHVLGCGVELADVQLRVHGDDRVVRGFEDGALARLALLAARDTSCRSGKAAPPSAAASASSPSSR